MAHYGWDDCPPHTRQQVDSLCTAIQHIADSSLVGIYLHGSLAMGCFNPHRSDIDLLAVTAEGLRVEQKRDLIETLVTGGSAPYDTHGLTRPVEISVVRLSDFNPWQYPTPYDLHYSEDWRQSSMVALATGGWHTWNGSTATDTDLAAHITLLNYRGITLAGQPILSVFPDVPRADYADSLLRDARDIRANAAANPAYSILNLCRMLAFFRDGLITSKDEAGAWAVIHAPEAHRDIIGQALDLYRGGNVAMASDPVQLEQFAADVLGEITRLLS